MTVLLLEPTDCNHSVSGLISATADVVFLLMIFLGKHMSTDTRDLMSDCDVH